MPDAVPMPGPLDMLLAQVDAVTALGAGGRHGAGCGGMMPPAFRVAREGSPLADGLKGWRLA